MDRPTPNRFLGLLSQLARADSDAELRAFRRDELDAEHAMDLASLGQLRQILLAVAEALATPDDALRKRLARAHGALYPEAAYAAPVTASAEAPAAFSTPSSPTPPADAVSPWARGVTPAPTSLEPIAALGGTAPLDSSRVRSPALPFNPEAKATLDAARAPARPRHDHHDALDP